MDEKETNTQNTEPDKAELTKAEVVKAGVPTRTRSIEELEKLPVSKMTPREIHKYVDYLRDAKITAENKNAAYSKAYESLQTQKNALEQQFNNYRLTAHTHLQYCKDTVAQAYKAILMMKDLESKEI